MDHNKLWKIPQETGILNKLTCLLRNLYAGQEATVKTGHGKRDWFQIGRIQQGCRVPEKTSISALLTIPKPLTVWITTNWKILQEMGIPDYLTCLLRNLYAGPEATLRTRYGTTDWFQIGKGVHQGYILSPYLFNLYAEYIM